MNTKTIEVDIDLDDFDDQELIDEIEHRGYVVKTEDNNSDILDREDWIFLLQIFDRIPVTWETRRLRDKILSVSY